MYPPMGWYPNDPRVMPVYQLAQEMDIPVLLHMGWCPPHPGIRSAYGRPIYLEEVGLATPRLKLLDRPRRPYVAVRSPAHRRRILRNFFFDSTSPGSSDPHFLSQVLEHESLGLRRLVLGTDGTGTE